MVFLQRHVREQRAEAHKLTNTTLAMGIETMAYIGRWCTYALLLDDSLAKKGQEEFRESRLAESLIDPQLLRQSGNWWGVDVAFVGYLAPKVYQLLESALC